MRLALSRRGGTNLLAALGFLVLFMLVGVVVAASSEYLFPTG